jgi:hypothetical protein
VSTLVAGARWAAGHPSGPQTAADIGMAIDTSLAMSAGHQPSGGRSSGSSGRSIRRSLRLVTTSSTLLKAGPAGGRQRRPSSAGAGVPSPFGGDSYLPSFLARLRNSSS